MLNNQVGVREIVDSHIEKQSVVPLVRQATLLGISRASVYYVPHPLDDRDERIIRVMDELYTKHPYYGSRRMAKDATDILKEPINRKHTQRLMDVMGLEALYPKPRLSWNGTPAYRFPYLLQGVTASRPNHIWGTDITYIRMKQGFVYLVAFIDWYSRYILSWDISITLDVSFVLDAATRALTIGNPEITNSDQGMQFTSNEYILLWNPDKTKISMDGRGRAMDNIFTERLWRTIKYEEVYLKDYATVREAKDNIGAYIEFYNTGRKHQSLQYKTPADIYFERG